MIDDIMLNGASPLQSNQGFSACKQKKHNFKRKFILIQIT
jgi:hypothetical protein